MELLLEENPWGTRAKRRKKQRNPPGAMAQVSKLTAGIDLAEIASGVGGYALTAYLPAQLIKPSAGKTTLSTGQQFMRVGIAAGAALLIGWLGTQFLGSKRARGAAFGGMVGAGVLAINTIRPTTIGEGDLGESVSLRRIGDARLVSPPTNRSEERVSGIYP